MDNFEIPFLLIASLWGAFSVVFKALELIRDQRGVILRHTREGKKDRLLDPMEIQHHAFFEWLPLWIGTSSFLLFLSVAIAVAPDLILSEGGSLDELRWLFYFAASIPAFGFLAFVMGGMYDIRLFKKARLQLASQTQPNQVIQPDGGCTAISDHTNR